MDAPEVTVNAREVTPEETQSGRSKLVSVMGGQWSHEDTQVVAGVPTSTEGGSEAERIELAVRMGGQWQHQSIAAKNSGLRKLDLSMCRFNIADSRAQTLFDVVCDGAAAAHMPKRADRHAPFARATISSRCASSCDLTSPH